MKAGCKWYQKIIQAANDEINVPETAVNFVM